MATEKQSKIIKSIKTIKTSGGARIGAGRKAGEPNKRTAEIQRAVEASGVTPLDFMLSIMRDDTTNPDDEPAQAIARKAMRFEAAKAAAPYVHAKLSSVDATITGANGGPVDINHTIAFITPNGKG
jgi:hypothetical protein